MLAFECRPTLHASPFRNPRDALLAAPLLQSRKRRLTIPTYAQRCVTPRLTTSVKEDENTYTVIVQAPGFKTDDLDITLDTKHELLTIIASTTSTHGSFCFERRATLPNADANSIATATHEDGVLTIKLKKASSEKTTIAVSDVPNATDVEGDEAAKPYMLTLAGPGVRASDIVVEALTADATLKISGETGSYRIHRTYKLPRDADVSTATATHVDGILRVMLPTKVLPEPVAIKITTPLTKEEDEWPSDKDVAEGAGERAAEGAAEAQAGVEQVAEEWRAEWDAQLDEMAEMGFEDRESSRAALIKHSGCIKRAMKELVASRVACA